MSPRKEDLNCEYYHTNVVSHQYPPSYNNSHPTSEQYNAVVAENKELKTQNKLLSKKLKDKDNMIQHQIKRISVLLEENKVIFRSKSRANKLLYRNWWNHSRIKVTSPHYHRMVKARMGTNLVQLNEQASPFPLMLRVYNP